ncbi:TIGR03943 family protein [Paenibacillus athensensis]|uniref:TIGR03943 family putative permease subunit n=1 Tax=Paenibacillus athensensis TaxID=1967502 RepID=UPI001431142E|nr:TIGR03943 family protein [Paenibacillus athensensis]MCD1258946.1 TIGR03943 family protein [Paenibacillus athensensis]
MNPTLARSRKLHAVIRTVILFLFSYYISTLVKGGDIEYYLAPRMVRYEKWAVIALFVVSLVQLYETLTLLFNEKKTELPACDCGHDHEEQQSPIKSALIYVLFLIPLAAGFLLPNTELGSAVFVQKGVQLTGSSVLGSTAGGLSSGTADSSADTAAPAIPADPSTLSQADLNKLFPNKLMQVFVNHGIALFKQPLIDVTEKQFMETLATVNLYLDNYVDKQIRISGFVYHMDNLGPNQYVLGRLAVGCCAADAIPVGVVVEGAEPMKLGNDSWVSVKGTIAKTKIGSQNVLLVRASETEKIKKPQTGFYVYRDSGFYLAQ